MSPNVLNAPNILNVPNMLNVLNVPDILNVPNVFNVPNVPVPKAFPRETKTIFDYSNPHHPTPKHYFCAQATSSRMNNIELLSHLEVIRL